MGDRLGIPGAVDFFFSAIFFLSLSTRFQFMCLIVVFFNDHVSIVTCLLSSTPFTYNIEPTKMGIFS